MKVLPFGASRAEKAEFFDSGRRFPATIMLKRKLESGHRATEASVQGRQAALLSIAWVGGIVCLALAVRLVYIAQMVPTPIFLGLSMDSNLFDKLALQIARGEWGHKDSIFLNEFYQFLLAGIYAVFGLNHMAVFLIQALLDAASCGLLYFIAAAAFWRSVGLVASLIYALYGIAIFYTGLILDTTVTIFLQLSFLSLFILGLVRYLPAPVSSHTGAKRISPDPSTPRTLGPCPSSPRLLGPFFLLSSGLVFGLLLMARPNLIAFLALLPVYAHFFLRRPLGWRRALGMLAVFGAGAAVVLALSVWRHHTYFNAWTPFPAHGGLNFYIGNNPQADGMFMSPGGVSSNPVTQVKDSIRLASRESGRELGPYEASGYWLGKGLGYLIRQPLDAGMLCLKKLVLLLRKEEVSLNIDYALSKELVPIFGVPFFGFGLVSPLGLLGVLFAVRRMRQKQALLLLYFGACAGSIILFFISDRYRLPAVPFFIIFAALAAVELGRAAAAREARKLAAAALPAALLFFLVNFDFDSIAGSRVTGTHDNNLATLYVRMGETEKALDHLKRAIECDPGIAAAHSNLGQLQVEMGNLEAGESSLRRALAIDPAYAVAHYNLGMALEKKGETEAALRHYRTAVDISPALSEARVNLAKMLLNAGDAAAARAHYQAALAEDPEFGPAYEGLGELLGRTGDFDAAARVFDQLLDRDPKNYSALVNAGLALKKLGRLDAALERFRRAAELEPRRVEAHLQLGAVYAARGQGEQAMVLFRKAAEIAPESYEAHLKIGIEHARKGEMAPAVDAFRRAVSVRPDGEEARINLVKAYLVAGEADSARREYQDLCSRMPAAAKGLEGFFRDARGS
jgi:tetratricopeptide (TPR) repeat protein